MGQKKISRRDFISQSSVGIASFAILKSRGESLASLPETGDGDIIYRELGKTGIQIPIISMGVMNADNPAVMKRAYDLGIRHFDTAWRYQNGRNEEMVGNVIEEMDIRDKIILATKVPLAFGNRSSYTLDELEDLKKTQGNDLEKRLKQDYLDTFETSLKRLKQKYVDILYVHSVKDPGTVQLPFLLEALAQLKKEGKTRFVGVSTHRNEVDIINKVVEEKFFDVILAPVNYKTSRREAIKEALRRANEQGIGIVAMKTQAVYDNSTETNHTAALKYVMQNTYITTAIPGFTTFDQLDEDFSVARNLEYTKEEEKYLNAFWEKQTAVNMPCQQCETCMDMCPQNIDVPDLMRTYMYATGYRNLEHARITYDSISKNRNLSSCTDCTSCRIKCPNGLDVASNIRHLKSIFYNRPFLDRIMRS